MIVQSTGARVRCALPRRSNSRVSPESAWPLKRANGEPFWAMPAARAAGASTPEPASRLGLALHDHLTTNGEEQ